MTDAQITKFSALIEAFENGDVGQVEFFEVGLEIGASLTALNEVLESVREEDNVGC